MVFAVDLAKRAFIKVLLQLAVTYAVKLSLSRDSPADAVNSAYRKVSLKVHPDKGGTDDQQTALNVARDVWETATAAAPYRGKKRKAAEAQTPRYEVHGRSVSHSVFSCPADLPEVYRQSCVASVHEVRP
jgi:hypothetical protein